MRLPTIDLAALEALPPKERAEAEEALALLEAHRKSNPLYYWEPFEKHSRLLKSKATIKMLAGGNAAGKTEHAVGFVLAQVCDREVLSPSLLDIKHFEPPCRVRIVSPDFTATTAMVIFEKLRKLTPKDQFHRGSWEKAFRASERVLRFKNGSFIHFATAEQDVDKHAGAAFELVVFDEEPPGDKGRLLFHENFARLREARGKGQLLFAMTPLLGLSWSFDEIVEKQHEPHIEVVTVSTDDNPTLSEDWKAQYFASMTDDERKARRYGQFVHFKGRVYDEFDENLHVVDPPSREHVKGLDVVVGIDPGLKQTGVAFDGFDADNSVLTFDELALPDHTVDQVAHEIRQKLAYWGLSDDDVLFVIDPSARNRVLTNAEAVESEYARCGIYCMHGQNDVEAGVLNNKRRFQAKPHPSKLVSRECSTMLWQLGRYRIEDRPDGKFSVVKKDDHVLDADRYATMSRPYGIGVEPQTRARYGWQPNNHVGWDQPSFVEPSPLGSMS